MSEHEDEGEGKGLDIELLRSYAAFAKSALRAHRVLLGVVSAVGLALTGLVLHYAPLTYSCSTTLMTVENAVLDGTTVGRPLVGAEGLMMSHQNLEAIVKATDLAHKYWPRRPPVLALKDWLKSKVSTPMSDQMMIQMLVLTLETRLFVTVKGTDQLEIRVDWNDPTTAAELADAAQKGFLELRHRTEIAAFEEKMSIFDSHAAETRREIDVLAAQMSAALESKAADMAKSGAPKPMDSKAPAMAFAPRARVGAGATPVADDRIPELREKLADRKQKLTAMESERTGRINSEKSKLEELKLHLTPSHPQVITQEERVGMASNVPSELAVLRSEVGDIEAQLKQREAMAKTSRATGNASSAGGFVASPSGVTGGASAEVLPSDVMHMLTNDNVDPALSAQISGAVVRYASLRDEVRGAKLALDTAQAAFGHRYQVVIPVEVPLKPSKPNLAILGLAGVVMSLLLGLAIPVLLELRRGVLVERWQVDHLNFPVLAELRLPERGDS